MIRAIPIIVDQTIAVAFVALICLFSPSAALAQDAAPSPPPPSDYVSRAEYDKLKAEHEAMKQELETLKAQIGQLAKGPMPAPAAAAAESKQVVTGAPAQAATEELRQEIDTLKTQVKETFPGSTKFLMAGYGTAGFTARSGEDPFFDAAFNALFLFKLTDRLFFEGEMELEFENNDHDQSGSGASRLPFERLHDNRCRAIP